MLIDSVAVRGEKMDKYRVYWVSTITGKGSKGEPLSKADADAWAEHGNKENPELIHWIVEEEAEVAP